MVNYKAKHFHVAIFGSARIKRNDPSYKRVYNLAKLIGKEGYDVVTGGGPGIMRAANSGHQAGKKNHNHSHSIGLNINLPFEQHSNRHIDIEMDFNKFSKRLDKFMYLSHAVVVCQGGIGTMLELFYTWQLTQVKKINHIPIILFGHMWEDLIKWVRRTALRNGLVSPQDLDNVHVAKTQQQVIKIINEAHNNYTCTNMKSCKLLRS